MSAWDFRNRWGVVVARVVRVDYAPGRSNVFLDQEVLGWPGDPVPRSFVKPLAEWLRGVITVAAYHPSTKGEAVVWGGDGDGATASVSNIPAEVADACVPSLLALLELAYADYPLADDEATQ